MSVLYDFHRVMVSLVRWAVLCWVFLIFFSFLSFLWPVADSVSHFRLHLSGALMAGGLYLALISSWRLGVVCMCIAFIGILSTGVDWVDDAEAGKGGAYIVKVMQLNLFYRNRSVAKVVKHIREENPDIVALQEVSQQNEDVLAGVKELLPYQMVCRFSAVGQVAVLSRFPFSEKMKGQCVRRSGLIWVRVQAFDRELSIASLHLYWPFPHRQTEQIEGLERELSRIPHPLIVAGDFNAAPWSHAVSRIEQASRTRVRSGLNFTLFKRFGVGWFKIRVGLPIDHILASERIFKLRVKRGKFVGSDHRPVTGVFALAGFL